MFKTKCNTQSQVLIIFTAMQLLSISLCANILENDTIKVTFQGARFNVFDKRNQKTWSTDLHPDIESIGSGIIQGGKYNISIEQLDVTFNLDGNALVIELSTDASSDFSSVPYPLLLPTSVENDFFVLPSQCGILVPASGNIPNMDKPFPGHQYHVGCSNGLNMPWFGITDMTAGCMVMFDTPNDAVVELKNRGETGIRAWVIWAASLGRFSYSRKLRLIFFDEGGYVSMCKLFRSFAIEEGYLKKLQEKIIDKEGAEKFIGAVFLAASGFTGWGSESLRIGRELKQEGVEKLMIFTFGSEAGSFSAETIEELKGLGFGVIRYDCYGSIGPEDEFSQKYPEKFPFIQGHYPEWAVKLENLEPEVCSWQLREQGREDIYNLCSQFQAPWAESYIPNEMAEKGWSGLYIDTTTMQKLHECFDPNHKETRAGCIIGRSALLEYVSSKGIFTASEGGCFWAAGIVDGAFGILSLPAYFLPVREGNIEYYQPNMNTFFGGLYCRIPIWELVYHDCTVSVFGKSDSNNRIKELWPYYDLISLLNGAIPTWVIDAEIYERDKEGFIESYKRLIPYIERINSVEMESHKFLSEDHLVQETVFANGVTVTVNLGDKEYQTLSGDTLLPLGFYVSPEEGSMIDIGEGNQDRRIPEYCTVSQNFPNPFNSCTIINYQLSEKSQVSLRIYNTLGRLVRILVDEKKPAGYYSVNWNGLDDSGKEAASGIYVYRLEAGDFVKMKSMGIMR